jgi:hypothetical protein
LKPHHQLILKRTLVATILVFMGLVILQDLFQFKKVWPLAGAPPPPADTSFSWENWKARKYQTRRDLYISQGFHLRSDFVRFYNSLEYTFFGKSTTNRVVIARQHHLMDKKQVEAYLGYNVIPEKDIENTGIWVHKIQDTLAKLHKKIYVVLVPDQPTIYPELIPPHLKKIQPQNNYELYQRVFKKYKVNCIDLVTYFKQLKNQGDPHLFPPRGSQWGKYGAALGLAYTLNELDAAYPENLTNLVIKGKVYTAADSVDMDLYHLLNLWAGNVADSIAQPIYEPPIKSGAQPRAVFIADDAMEAWLPFGITQMFTNTTYVKYNKEIITDTTTGTPNQITPGEWIEKNDLFLVVCKVSHLDQLGWGFIPQIYFHFYPQAPGRILYDTHYQKKIRTTMDDIQAEKNWYNLVIEKAEKNNRTIDKQLYLDAVWIVEHQK